MIVKTEDLITSLATDVGTPVQRLRPPSARLVLWLTVSLPWIALVVALMGPRSDLAFKFQEQGWLVEQGAALAVALTAAMAAFCAAVPGRPIWERAAPVVPLLVWLSTLSKGCLEDFLSADPQGLGFHTDWACVPGIVMVGLVPGIAMAVMLRRGAPMAPVLSVGLGGLAASALADFGLRLFHTTDASLMVIVWQVGTVALLTALSALLGRRLLRWRHELAA
jgi:hypothetical protein